MPILPNDKWEIFAKGIAAGFSLEAAQEAAGIPKNKGNGSVLKNKPIVAARIKELLQDQTFRFAKDFAKAESDKVKFIAMGYKKLYDAIVVADVRSIQEIKVLAETILQLEKDKRVESGGVSDRTAERNETNLDKLTDEELNALELSLVALDDRPKH